MESGFVRDIDLLNETCQADDLLDFSASISDFKKYLSRIHKHSLVGLIGNFGSGKSTMLYQLEKESPKQWFVFDAWAFPDRKDLWEGFVLDFARNVSMKEFSKARKRIDGKSLDDAKSLIGVLAEGINLFLPGAGIVKNFSALFKSSSARRTFEFREMFRELVDRCDGDLCIVLEDIDRSGKEGAVFLETLKQFIEHDLEGFSEHKIIFVVPMGTENYDGICAGSYRKSLDYTYQFKPKVNFEGFIDAVFLEETIATNKEHWKEQMNKLFQFYISKKTIRDLKKLLREANQSFLSMRDIENFLPDPRVVVMMEMFYSEGNRMSHIQRRNDVRTISALEARENIYAMICLAIFNNGEVQGITGGNMPEIVFEQNHNLVIPKEWRDMFDEEHRSRLQLSALYLREEDRNFA